MMLLLKIAYWVAGILLFGFIIKFMGGGGENLLETNFIQWIGEVVLMLGWFYGMLKLHIFLWDEKTE
jgi:hypothetical protein